MASKILQINLHHSKAASASFCRTFTSGSYDLALIQEPWLHRGRIAGLADARGRLIYCNNVNNPRACIVVKSGLQGLPLTEFCSRDLTAIEICWSEGDVRSLIVCSAYLPYNSREPPPTPELRKLVEATQLSGARILVGCDSNAHSHLGWGSHGNNHRGENLLEFLVANNLQILNVGSAPTFVNRVRSEVIDITFCSNSLGNQISNWSVLDQASLSDHRYIHFYVNATTSQTTVRNPRWTNWHSWAEQVTAMSSSLAGRINSIADLEHTASTLNDAMQDAFSDNCPERIRKGKSSINWWSADLDRRRKQVRRMFNHAKRHGTWQAYHASLTQYSKAVRQAKFNSWAKFTGEVSSLKEAARLSKVMASKPVNPIGTLKMPNGKFTESAGETLDLLLQTHFPGCINITDPERCPDPAYGSSPRASREGWALANRIITLTRLKWAINKFSPYKSPGGDGIYPAMLQNVSHPVLLIICELFRASVAFGHVPRVWRISRVVFIPKRGRRDYSQAKAFRHISLSSFLLKTVEKLVERYIRDKVLSGQPLHRNQHAYQAGRSCVTALSELVGKAEYSLANKEIALCAFLDIEGAFDNTSHEVITANAIERGIPSIISTWISNTLRTRRVQSSLLNETRSVCTVRGCPQGGVLSPLLWNLVVDDLLRLITETGIHIQGYADDIVLIVQGKFIDTVVDVMNNSLRDVSTWCNKVGLKVNPAKTVVLPFTRKRNLTTLARLRLDNVQLTVSDNVKYLGVVLDSKLTWNAHLAAATHKAKWALMSARSFIGKTWGLRPLMVSWLYRAVVRPQVTYAALVWWTKTQQATVKVVLNSLQRLACLCISGAFTSTSTAALELLLNLSPLDLFIEQEARKFYYRLTKYSDFRLGSERTAHLSVMSPVAREPLLLMSSDAMIGEFLFAKPFTTNVGSRREWDKGSQISKWNSSVVWYTDGSLINGKAGYGAHRTHPRCNLSGSLGGWCTVFQAEIYAILACSLRELSLGTKDRSIVIFSDSQAALKALDGLFFTSRLVWECVQTLCILSRRNMVHLEWIPGHRGFKGNEKADLLARKGALSVFNGPEPVVGVSPSLVYSLLKERTVETHSQRWRGHSTNSVAYLLVKGPCRSLTSSILNLNRTDLRLVISFLTGHGHFRQHLLKMGLFQGDPVCRLCESATETAKHILMECPSLEIKRRGLLGGQCWEELSSSELGGIILGLCKPTGVGLPS